MKLSELLVHLQSIADQVKRENEDMKKRGVNYVSEPEIRFNADGKSYDARHIQRFFSQIVDIELTEIPEK